MGAESNLLFGGALDPHLISIQFLLNVHHVPGCALGTMAAEVNKSKELRWNHKTAFIQGAPPKRLCPA